HDRSLQDEVQHQAQDAAPSRHRVQHHHRRLHRPIQPSDAQGASGPQEILTVSRYRVQAKGAIAAPVEITDIHILTRDDLHVLAQPRPQNVVQTLRDSHHRLARAVAMGLSNAEAVVVTGYSINRVSMFRQDPAFKELVAHKRAMIDTEWAVDA